MTRLIFLAWGVLLVISLAFFAIYDWFTADEPAYKTGGNADGWKRRGSNMRDDQQGAK